MPFLWTAYRQARVSSAVRSYNRALTNRAKELEQMGEQALIKYLPPRQTVADVKSRIHSVQDFRRIVGYKTDIKRGQTAELNRILKSVRPDALDFVLDQKGYPITKYQEREYQNHKRAIRRQRNKVAREMSQVLYEGDTPVNIEEMSAQEFASATTDNDLMPDDFGEYDDSVEDQDYETYRRWQYEDAQNKHSQVLPDAMIDVYLDTWKSPLNHHDAMPGYQQLIDAMEWLVENKTPIINKMFAIGYDELDPYFITESGGASNPYVNIPYEVRHNRAVRFVTDIAKKAGYVG